MLTKRSLLSIGSLLLAFCTRGQAAAGAERENGSWPNGPFKTSGRWIKDASGANVTYAGVNWPGHADVMIPEGLQYQSIEAIVSQITDVKMNAIRLTYAIEMVDQIYANDGEDVAIKKALTDALGSANGAKVLAQILKNNPQFTEDTTRLQVFDAVVQECAKQHVFIHLDNHISKGKWCCSGNDGNTWWGDTQFPVDNWVRGLHYMANHGKNWTNLMSMSLRNEPREPPNNSPAKRSYNWRDWYGFVRNGTEAIHSANPDVLIFLSGLGYDTTMTPVAQGGALTPGSGRFSKDDFSGYGDKLVLELHDYENDIGSCGSLEGNLNRNGFSALDDDKFPVMLTEFGFQMDATTWKRPYSSCLASFLSSRKAGWFLWALSGSYYIRSGTQDYEEGWGLLTHDWSGWRSPSYIDGMFKKMVTDTLS